MRVEIDQSGRLEHLNTDTVIGYANGRKGAVLIKVKVKRQLISKLKRSAIPNDHVMPILFAVCIYFLVNDLNRQSVLVIDEEYTGKDSLIEATLMKLLGPKWGGSIRFGRIGKKSPAHDLAWMLHRYKRRRTEVRKLTFAEIDRVLFGK